MPLKLWVCSSLDERVPPTYTAVTSLDDIKDYIREWEVSELNIQMQVGREPRTNDQWNGIAVLRTVEDMILRYNDYLVPLMFCHETEKRDRVDLEKKIVQLLKMAKAMGRRVRRGA